MDREAVMTALLDLATTAVGFRTTGRDLLHWSGVTNQPALFVVDSEEMFPARSSNLPGVQTMSAELWIYTKGDERADKSRPKALNALLDAVEAALAPDLVTNVQTLGGVVVDCSIQGRIDKSPGHVDGQAVAVIDVMMIVPRF